VQFYECLGFRNSGILQGANLTQPVRTEGSREKYFSLQNPIEMISKPLARDLVSLSLSLPMALFREGTIPTERLSLVGEVNANFCG
jgi:hypothetical protein